LSLFNRVAIIGMGLIGSSLARRIRAEGLAGAIVAIDRNAAVCARVTELGIADEVTDKVAEGIKGCDLAVIAVPVGSYSGVAIELGPHIPHDCIVTDVGSVKQSCVDALWRHLPATELLVPGHPIAGTEHSGPDAGFPGLFENRWCILTPLPNTSLRAIEKVTRLWEACGANIEMMEPRRHDLVLAITSHLPHLIAYTIVDTATTLEDDTRNEVIKYSASGFRDFTRIAASDPTMWRDIFLHNRDAVLEILQRFNEDLTALQRAIRRGEGEFLHDTFARTRNIRRRIIAADQAGTATAAATPPQAASPDESRQATKRGS
jgi:cyclohexadieny/prephenate dehydrogenase